MGSMQGRGVDSKIVGDQVKATSSGEVAEAREDTCRGQTDEVRTLD